MNWKIIVGGIIIFAGSAQFFKILAVRMSDGTSLAAIMWIGIVIIGIYLVRQGRLEAKK